MRLAIADSAYQQLWETDRTQLLMGLGEHLPLLTSFVRVLTVEGIIVEAGAYRTSELGSLALHEWKVLFSRLPYGEPRFQQLPARSPAELWPEPEPLTAESVRQLTNWFLLKLANDPATLFSGELHSARWVLDDLRTDLLKLMYRRLGLVFAKRYKHLSHVLPAAWIADLERTYVRPGARQLDPIAIATALIELFAVTGKHLQALSDQAGGGFEAHWYQRLYEQVKDELTLFIQERLPP